MMDNATYQAIRQIKATAQAIEREPDSKFTESRARELVMFATAVLEREDRGRAILEELLERENRRHA